MPFDENGAILSWSKKGHEPILDGGDALAETSRYHHMLIFLKWSGLSIDEYPFREFADYEWALRNVLTVNGEFVRYSRDWNDPKIVSRDQLAPTIIAHAAYGMPTLPIFKTLLRNWKRFPNGDLCSPEHLGFFFRHKSEWLSPYFWISDLFMLLNSIIIFFRHYLKPESVENDLNHIHALMQARMYNTTPVSWLALWVYLKRPNGPEWAIEKYYSHGGNGFLIPIYQKVLRALRMERMKTYTPVELKEILERHGKWMREEEGGKRADLSYSDLSLAELSNTNLNGADLRGADLTGADLQRAELIGAELLNANLRRADLRGAILADAFVDGASLREADLRGANISGANMRGVNLSGAYLQAANLTEADLSGATFSGTELSGAFLLDVKSDVRLANFCLGKHSACLVGDELTIDCETHPLSYWLENFETIGKKYGYTPEQIKLYGAVIKALAD